MTLRTALSQNVLIIDGAMGTMLQSSDVTMDAFQGLEGCNEILNVTRPDVISGIHDAYLDAGADIIETNTFGANLPALTDYGIASRASELASAATKLAREAADKRTDKPRYVVGSIGPGTKLPTLRQIGFAAIRDVYQQVIEAMIDAGIDGVQIETCQDLLQARAAIIGAHRAAAAHKVNLPVLVDFTVETTGTMLMGSETGAALTVLESLGVDAIGLNCATGPAEMAEHLRTLSRGARVPIMCMPNAGLPEITGEGRVTRWAPMTWPQFLTNTSIATGWPSSVAAVVPLPIIPGPLRSGCPVDRFLSETFTTSMPLLLYTATSRSVRIPLIWPSANALMPTVPGRSVRPCWLRSGTSASTLPKPKPAMVPIYLICALTTSGATAFRTCQSCRPV